VGQKGLVQQLRQARPMKLALDGQGERGNSIPTCPFPLLCSLSSPLPRYVRGTNRRSIQFISLPVFQVIWCQWYVPYHQWGDIQASERFEPEKAATRRRSMIHWRLRKVGLRALPRCSSRYGSMRSAESLPTPTCLRYNRFRRLARPR